MRYHDSGRDLSGLPKAHLHVHLDGAVRQSTLTELCAEAGMAAPTLPSGDRYESFSAFMEAIQATHIVLRDPTALRRVVHEVIEDSVADGAIWVEPSVWPGVFGSGAAARGAIETVLEAGAAHASALGVGFGLMIAANRHESPEDAVDAAKLAIALRSAGVRSFGLDGDERANPPEAFVEAFRIATDGGLISTPHAGELCGPESVSAALDDLKAGRILHGVRALEDEEVVQQLVEADVCLDVCPTSNYRLSVVDEMANHPLPQLVAAGVTCSLNADDPTLFQSSLLGEYEVARSVLGLTDQALATIALDSIKFSGASAAVREDAAEKIANWLRGAE